MDNNRNHEIQENKSFLRKRIIQLAIGLLIILLALGVATFAWYIYNTQSHTTKVHMAAGTSTRLEIAKAYDGPYKSSVELDSFKGTLNPVSTNKVSKGFETVYGFNDDVEKDKSKILANLFGPAHSYDYFKTTLFLRTNAKDQGIYVCGMNYSDDEDARLLATAMRVGLVVHEPGESEQPVDKEYIFELSNDHNPEARYNTAAGRDGEVLDSSSFSDNPHKPTMIKPETFNEANFANYNSETGEVTLKANSEMIMELKGSEDGKGKPGEPVQVDVYLWLEGCDADCTGNLMSKVLKNFAISFGSYDIN